MLLAKRVFYLVLSLVITSCATVHEYPLYLSYQPQTRLEAARKGDITITLFNDGRKVAGKRYIGIKNYETPFVSVEADPALSVTEAVRTYLQRRGYTTVMAGEGWNGTDETLNPQWGDIVVGGTINDLTVTVLSEFPKTKYECSVKLAVVIADAKTKKILQKQEIGTSSSYVTVAFSKGKAEELINETLSDAIEKSLNGIDKYVPGR